jgi:DNA-binding CsgD family transcriptional regulator
MSTLQDAHVIVGRNSERAALTDFVTRADGPAALLLQGEAGIGKTTLLRDALAHAGDRRVLACRPAQAETPLAFAALADLLDGVELNALPAPQRRALQVALLHADGTADPHAVAAGFLSLLRSAGPVVLAIDDVQWLDAASRAAIEFALRRLTAEPVAVLLAQRGTGEPALALGGLPVRRLEPAPLGRGALHRLLLARLGVSFPRPLVQRVHASTGGNPLYALELASALQRRGALPRGDEPLPVPAGLVEERLAALPDELRAFLELVAALLERRLPVVRALDEDGSLDAAVAAGLLEVGRGRVAFTHPLLATAVYGLPGPDRRREIQARLAVATAGTDEEPVHLALAADRPDAALAERLDAAAARARARGGAAAAAWLSEGAARLSADPEDKGRRRITAAEHHLVAGDNERGRTLLTGEIARLGPGATRAQALSLLAWAGVDGASLPRAAELLNQALVEGGDDAETRLRLAIVEGIRGHLVAAEAHAIAAVALNPARELHARALAQLGYLRTLRGAGVVPASREAAAMEAELGFLGQFSPSVCLGQVLVYTDAYEEARAVLNDALERAVAAGHEDARGTCLYHLADLERRAGDWAAARAFSDRARAVVAQSGNEQENASCLVVGALLDAGLGRVDVAREAARRGIEAAAAMGDETFLIHHRGVAGFAALSLGDARAAADTLAPATDALLEQGVGELSIYPVVQYEIDARAELADEQRLRHLIARLGQLPPRPFTDALIARAAGEPDLSYTAQPFEHARALLVLGRQERRAKRKRAARDALEAAMRIFTALPAPLWAAKADAEMRRLGIRKDPAELTETEARIARLAAQGLSNPEIAAAVFVSRKTVEANLSKAYRKLGVRSRVELARRELPD